MSIVVKSLSYIHPDRETLFENISFSVLEGEHISLVGNNGTGKSTLLQIIDGNLSPSGGEVLLTEPPYYVPQHLGQYDDCSVQQALGVEPKISALHAILKGDASEQNFAILNEDWNIEERVQDALSYWNIEYLNLEQKMGLLSGGEKTKVFLCGILIHSPEIILLDEPSNHLDSDSRNVLYKFVKENKSTMLVVSHDRTLLNLLDTTLELRKSSIEVYGGNYDFYKEQKDIEMQALSQDLQNKEKMLRKAKEIERETKEKRQKLDARGKNRKEKEGTPRIMMKTLKDNAEKTTSQMSEIQAQKIGTMSQEVGQLRKDLFEKDKMKLAFDAAGLHRNKILVKAENINWKYSDDFLWKQPLTFTITSGERLAIKGGNGVGKTTLIKLILGDIEPLVGTIQRIDLRTIYIDQNYSLINNNITVFQQAELFNDGKLQEYEINIRLARFLFTKDYWNKPCTTLSGGERMRLLLCCMTISNQAPDIIILDEPTNNLDIQNIEILTRAVNEYKGTLIVISHDSYFQEQIKIERSIELG